jgi:hypothetical protein
VPDPLLIGTLAIDDALLQWARGLALQQSTSVNALVRELLGRYGEARRC